MRKLNVYQGKSQFDDSRKYRKTDALVTMKEDAFNPIIAGDQNGYNFVWSVAVEDDNGDLDVDNVAGYFFDDTAIDLTSGACTPDENDCYENATCTLSGLSSSGGPLEILERPQVDLAPGAMSWSIS